MSKKILRKNKRRTRKKIIADPAIVNFLGHLRPSKIDFSKIKIPPYIKYN